MSYNSWTDETIRRDTHRAPFGRILLAVAVVVLIVAAGLANRGGPDAGGAGRPLAEPAAVPTNMPDWRGNSAHFPGE